MMMFRDSNNGSNQQHQQRYAVAKNNESHNPGPFQQPEEYIDNPDEEESLPIHEDQYRDEDDEEEDDEDFNFSDLEQQ